MLIGDSSVGKSALLSRFTKDEFRYGTVFSFESIAPEQYHSMAMSELLIDWMVDPIAHAVEKNCLTRNFPF